MCPYCGIHVLLKYFTFYLSILGHVNPDLKLSKSKPLVLARQMYLIKKCRLNGDCFNYASLNWSVLCLTTEGNDLYSSDSDLQTHSKTY